MAVDERLARLELTVAKGLVELGDKMQLLLERMDAHIHEMRVTTEAIVKEHRADRRVIYSMLGDQRVRIEALESHGHGPEQGS